MARGKDSSDFERGFIVGSMASASVVTVTKVTSAFKSMEKTSVNRV